MSGLAPLRSKNLVTAKLPALTLWWSEVQPCSSCMLTSAPRVTSIRTHFKLPSLTSWWKAGLLCPPSVFTNISGSTLGRFKNWHISEGSPSLTISWKTKSCGNFTLRSITFFRTAWLGRKKLQLSGLIVEFLSLSLPWLGRFCLCARFQVMALMKIFCFIISQWFTFERKAERVVYYLFPNSIHYLKAYWLALGFCLHESYASVHLLKYQSRSVTSQLSQCGRQFPNDFEGRDLN